VLQPATTSVGMSSSPTISSSSSSMDQATRVHAMVPWIALCGRYLYFAGSQLLLAMDDPAVARTQGLDAFTVHFVGQVRGRCQHVRHPGSTPDRQCMNARMPCRLVCM
jgi:hypothetical protein